MATTSPDNIRTPNPGDPYNLVADLAVLANDVQDALIERANSYTGTAAQRSAFTSSAPDGTLWVDIDGDKNVWKKVGAEWVNVVTRGGFLPFSMSAGLVSITPVPNTATSTTVTFPAGRFTQTPIIVVSAHSGASTIKEVSFTNPSPTSVDIVLVRENSVLTTVHWTAVQMTPTSATG